MSAPPAEGAAARSPVHALLRPRSIAVYGASAAAGTFGHSLLAAALGWAYAGRVYAVNPRYDTLAGIRCYPDLASLPEAVDCVAFAVRDDRLPDAMSAAAAAGARAGVVFARGYHPPGTAQPTPTERWSAIAREAGIAVCGDNCMGFTNFVDRLRVSGYPVVVDEPSRGVVLLSHSGSTWSGLIGSQRQIGLSHAVSVGSERVTGLADYVEFALDQPDTRVIALVMETVRDPDAFTRALERASSQGVPVVALKLGRSEQGRHFARSHSGAIAGSAAAFDAFFEHHGVASVRDLDELADTVEMLSCERTPTTNGVAFGTDSGGERQLICDVAAEVGLSLASFAPRTAERLADILDPGLEVANPVDYWGDGRIYFRECLQIMAEDPGVGAVVMATNMVSGRELLRITCETAVSVAASTAKPVAKLGHIHSTIDREAAARLRAAGIPVLMGTTTGLRALRHFLDHHRRRREPAREGHAPQIAQHHLERWRARLDSTPGPLPIADALDLLRDFGCPVAPGRVVSNANDAAEAARVLGFPLVAKTANADILHRSDIGALHVGLANETQLAAAYAALATGFGADVLVQRQCDPGVELLFGVVVDEALGPMATVAMGGIFVEVHRDVLTFVPPVGADRALELLRRLRGFALLEGARGRARCDIDALARALAAFSTVASVLGPHLAEADVNPVIAGPWGVAAVDALFLPRAAIGATRRSAQ